MRRTSNVIVVVGVVACALSGVGVTACSSDEPEPEGHRWQASAQTAGALGISHWIVRGDLKRAELAGVQENQGDKLVVHGVLERTDDRLTIRMDKPRRWHFSYTRGEVPAMSGQMPARVGIALAGSALELVQQLEATNGTAPKTRPLLVADGLRPQDALLGGSDGRGGLTGGASCLTGGRTRLIEPLGARSTAMSAPYYGFGTLNGLPPECYGGSRTPQVQPPYGNPYATSNPYGGQPILNSSQCQQAAQQYACPGWNADVYSDTTRSDMVDVLGMILQHSLAQQQIDAQNGNDDEDDEDDDEADAGASCESPVTYYKDGDGDGFGGTETMSSCTPPGDGWVTKPGDCFDGDKNVFPGQAGFFMTPYQKPDGTKSFDYDCSQNEEQSGTARTAAGTCTPNAEKTACTGSGFVAKEQRTGASDPLCGQVQLQQCVLENGACAAVLTAAEPTPCH